ncbi:MAG TPA: type II secretion system F family protein [Thermoplasmata archaeon]|nr:type II secretion system F family protein [Thermoplasmata archaeon]
MSASSETVAPSAGADSPAALQKRRPVFLSRYRTLSYHLFGERLEEGGGSDVLAERLRRAGFAVSPAMHTGMMLLTVLVAASVSAVVSFLLFFEILHSTQWYLYELALVGISATSVVAGFRFLVDSRISNRKSQLERELPFTLSELSVLASTGTSPIRLMRRMAQRDHDPAMTETFRQVIYKTDIQGKDLITALADTAKSSPSTSVRDTLWDLANMIHQGGNLDEYLRSKSDAVLQLKRLIQKEFIERLSTFLDMYVSLVLVGVLMIAVAAFLLNALGSTAAGLNADELLLLLTFGLVPLAVAMTIIMVSIAYAGAE